MFHHPPSKPYTQTTDVGESSPPPTGRDRGPAVFFHGRKAILSRFETVLSETIDLDAGTTFLIQGAPGAGKTALLDVLSHQSKSKGWTVVDIRAQDLYNPASMAQSLGESYVIDKQYAANVGIHGLGGGYSRNVAGYSSVDGLLKEVAPEGGLILVLDEAQYLINLNDTPAEKHVARDTLDVIHNGRIGRPVMLLAAGLGTTESAFTSLGISRFEGESLINLGRLDKKSERAVLCDWIVKEGKAIGDPTPWVDAIAQQTHGWPQHIISYVKPAVRYLKSNNHRMTDEGLCIVLEKGAEHRIQYYRQRARGIDKRKRQVLAKIFNKIPLGETMEIDDIKSSFKQEYSKEEADHLFDKALEKGIIDERDDGDYGIPIPSMQTWLIEEYGRERIEMPKIEDESSKVRRGPQNQEKDSSKWSLER